MMQHRPKTWPPYPPIDRMNHVDGLNADSAFKRARRKQLMRFAEAALTALATRGRFVPASHEGGNGIPLDAWTLATEMMEFADEHADEIERTIAAVQEPDPDAPPAGSKALGTKKPARRNGRRV